MHNQSYSQLGQDLYVLEKFPIKDGYFADIGFNDGVGLSNTYLLELNGWTGLGVDPLPQNYECRKNTQIFTEVLYSESDIELEFIEYGTLSGITQLINHHKDVLEKSQNRKILKTKTLEQIFDTAKAPTFIHYLSLDTEGSEYEIMRVFPFEKYKFGCISVEHNFLQSERDRMRKLLEHNGYYFDKALQWDDIYLNGKIFNE